MGLLLVNGVSVLHASIRMPRYGCWHSDLVVDSTNDLNGAVTIATDDGAFSLVGTVVRHGVFTNTLSIRVVGGAGGLAADPMARRTVAPKFYQNVPASIVAREILGAVGETLSAASDAGLMAQSLPNWSRNLGTPEACLARLVEYLGCLWRVLPDGSTWLGNDTFPAAPTNQFDVLNRYFGEGRIVIGCERPFLLPGVALTISDNVTSGVQNVSAVVHTIAASSVRSEVWFQ